MSKSGRETAAQTALKGCGRDAETERNGKGERSEGQKDFSISCQNKLDLSRLIKSCNINTIHRDLKEKSIKLVIRQTFTF